jgi:hypothetical protein
MVAKNRAFILFGCAVFFSCSLANAEELRITHSEQLTEGPATQISVHSSPGNFPPGSLSFFAGEGGRQFLGAVDYHVPVPKIYFGTNVMLDKSGLISTTYESGSRTVASGTEKIDLRNTSRPRSGQGSSVGDVKMRAREAEGSIKILMLLISSMTMDHYASEVKVFVDEELIATIRPTPYLTGPFRNPDGSLSGKTYGSFFSLEIPYQNQESARVVVRGTDGKRKEARTEIISAH